MQHTLMQGDKKHIGELTLNSKGRNFMCILYPNTQIQSQLLFVFDSIRLSNSVGSDPHIVHPEENYITGNSRPKIGIF